MAREAAHQAGAPLASLHGWVDMLREHNDPAVAQALMHMERDIARLERVTGRVERIASAPLRSRVDLTAIACDVVRWFSGWVPALAHPIAVRCEAAAGACLVTGDGVLLEWAIELLVQNAVEALASNGGAITVSVDRRAGDKVRLRVADTGPGVSTRLRRKIFSAGFSTRKAAPGMGLAIARRIVFSAHGGRVRIVPSTNGALFEMVVPA
jgi:hypothetical protein